MVTQKLFSLDEVLNVLVIFWSVDPEIARKNLKDSHVFPMTGKDVKQYYDRECGDLLYKCLTKDF